jgi:uncharacterized glyoxalase superfamily protein PhnB
MNKSSKPIPEGFHTITAHLVLENAAEAVEFYKRAFGAEEVSRMPAPDGRLMHAEIKLGNSIVMIADDFPEWGPRRSPQALKGSPVTLHMYVPDADAVFNRAVAAGATASMPPADTFWGDRYSTVTDPFGHVWAIATHQYDYSPEEMNRRFEEMMSQMTQGAH